MEVPRPISSISTSDCSVAACTIAAASVISTMKVDCALARSSAAPIRVWIASSGPSRQPFAGTYEPIAASSADDASGTLADGTPVVFDPAVYCGDREADLAMTELFGGFPKDFYAAYRAAWPLDEGYPVRRDFYNLYHVLNHANLFSGSYVEQGARLIERLIAEIR